MELLDPSADQFQEWVRVVVSVVWERESHSASVLAVAPIQSDEGGKFERNRVGIFVHEG